MILEERISCRMRNFAKLVKSCENKGSSEKLEYVAFNQGWESGHTRLIISLPGQARDVHVVEYLATNTVYFLNDISGVVERLWHGMTSIETTEALLAMKVKMNMEAAVREGEIEKMDLCAAKNMNDLLNMVRAEGLTLVQNWSVYNSKKKDPRRTRRSLCFREKRNLSLQWKWPGNATPLGQKLAGTDSITIGTDLGLKNAVKTSGSITTCESATSAENKTLAGNASGTGHTNITEEKKVLGKDDQQKKVLGKDDQQRKVLGKDDQQKGVLGKDDQTRKKQPEPSAGPRIVEKDMLKVQQANATKSSGKKQARPKEVVQKQADTNLVGKSHGGKKPRGGEQAEKNLDGEKEEKKRDKCMNTAAEPAQMKTALGCSPEKNTMKPKKNDSPPNSHAIFGDIDVIFPQVGRMEEDGESNTMHLGKNAAPLPLTSIEINEEESEAAPGAKDAQTLDTQALLEKQEANGTSEYEEANMLDQNVAPLLGMGEPLAPADGGFALEVVGVANKMKLSPLDMDIDAGVDGVADDSEAFNVVLDGTKAEKSELVTTSDAGIGSLDKADQRHESCADSCSPETATDVICCTTGLLGEPITTACTFVTDSQTSEKSEVQQV
ncbi:unnamed protein product, partial [Amoebophrya sp. A25]|eukprot:GSA25T00015554001.1